MRNKFLKNLVIIGIVIIAILLGALFYVSHNVKRELEVSYNEGIKEVLNVAQGIGYVANISPTECSGFLSITCSAHGEIKNEHGARVIKVSSLENTIKNFSTKSLDSSSKIDFIFEQNGIASDPQKILENSKITIVDSKNGIIDAPIDIKYLINTKNNIPQAEIGLKLHLMVQNDKFKNESVINISKMPVLEGSKLKIGRALLSIKFASKSAQMDIAKILIDTVGLEPDSAPDGTKPSEFNPKNYSSQIISQVRFASFFISQISQVKNPILLSDIADTLSALILGDLKSASFDITPSQSHFIQITDNKNLLPNLTRYIFGDVKIKKELF